MGQINIDYLYDIYKDEYADDRNEGLLDKEAFIETIEEIIENKIRDNSF